MPLQRRVVRTITTPAPARGFVGEGHLAVEVVRPNDFVLNDPFILLMDDRLDIGERPVGAPHPHAGFETVTFLLEGTIEDRDEGGVLHAGDVQWMTAGRGIIHGENTRAKGHVRLLQLWLTLPKSERWTRPGVQVIRLGSIPVRREVGVEVRLYSGTSGEHHSKTRNHVPVTLADIRVEASRAFEQEVPTSYNGFLYVISGSARVGEERAFLKEGQVGWLDRPAGNGVRALPIVAGEHGVRLVLYAGQAQGDPIVSHGPFIGDSREDIARLYNEYRAGRFERMSEFSKYKDG